MMDSPTRSHQFFFREDTPLVPRFQLTSKQKDDIKKTFDLLDQSGSGTIDADKFRVAVSALGYEMNRDELKKRLMGLYNGPPEKLSLQQFTILLMRKMADRDSSSDIVKSFLAFDTDNTGTITFVNIQNISKKLGEDLTDEEISEMIDDIDDTGEGAVSLDQFARMINKSVNLDTP